MYPLLRKACTPQTNPLSFYSNLLSHCFSLKSLEFATTIHAQLIKFGLNTHTFLGSRCLDLYSQLGNVCDLSKAFDEIEIKNCVAWNICLKGYVKFGYFERACQVFDEMPERDVVSWNSMISGYASYGCIDRAFELLWEMRDANVRADAFTFTILMSLVPSRHHIKEIHASMIRNCAELSSLVLENSLIDLYGKAGLVDYAFGVFWTMKEWDTISWNSLILSCYKSGYKELALYQFFMMRSAGFFPDQFTASTVITVCSTLQNSEKGELVFVLCVKNGFLSNSVVLSAAIDLFSKCNRLDDSIQLFKEAGIWDSAVCNSMISSYSWHGLAEDALKLFSLILIDGVRITDFTLSIALNSASLLFPVEQGSQIHSIVLKLGWDSDKIVASSLMDMYAKFGVIEYAEKIFVSMDVKDLISWNTLIMAMARNGWIFKALETFKELLQEGLAPDRITMAGVLVACSHGALVDEGMGLFSSMEKDYGVKPTDEHYACIIDMLSQAGKLEEAIKIIETSSYEPSAMVWSSMLHASRTYGDLLLAETVSKRLICLEPQSCLPYEVLAWTYEMRGKWESVVRFRKIMEERGAQRALDCSWIGVRAHIIVFKANQIVPLGDQTIRLILNLLIWEITNEGSVYQQSDNMVMELDDEQRK